MSCATLEAPLRRSLNVREVSSVDRASLSGANRMYVFMLRDGSRWGGFGVSARQAMLSVERMVREVVS